jgi:hypothetical protein
MFHLHTLPAAVHGIRVLSCAPEVEAQVEDLFAEVLAFHDGDRVAVEEVDGTDVLCFFVEQGKVRSVVTGLAALGLIAEQTDLTQDLLLGRSCGAVYDTALARYRHLVDAFRRQHLTVNDVLDKIGTYGFISLDDVEREVLAMDPGIRS